MTAAPPTDAFADAVRALPEIYQPIFGYPELSDGASRPCEDRLEHIMAAYHALSAHLDRPLRVLDLGCAQGFFSHHLAARGAIVHGVDYIEANVAVCRGLAVRHPEHRVNFEVGRIEDALTSLETDQYDLVLGLSVFHHIVHTAGIPSVRRMLGELAPKVAMALFELALPSEPAFWASAQPDQPRQLLEGFDFVHELARHRTHLSGISRPLYVASSRYWFLSGRLGPFDDARTTPHTAEGGMYQQTRSYYSGAGLIAKLFRLDNEVVRTDNIEALRKEANFLRNVPEGLTAPALVLYGESDREVWLVRERPDGELLLDFIRKGRGFDPAVVLRDVLAYLVALERAGLYHGDVRLWNVLVTHDGRGVLIDYGAISAQPVDCAWPYDVFLSFLIFTREVLSAESAAAGSMRPPWFDPDGLPEPYRQAFWSMLLTPPNAWRFQRLRDDIEHPAKSTGSTAPQFNEALSRILSAVEEMWRVHTTKLAGMEEEVLVRRQQVVDLSNGLRTAEEERRRSEEEILLRRRQVSDLSDGLRAAEEERRRSEEEILLRRRQVADLGNGLRAAEEERRRSEEEVLLRRRQVTDLGNGLRAAEEERRRSEEEILLRRQQVTDLGNALRAADEERRRSEDARLRASWSLRMTNPLRVLGRMFWTSTRR